MAREIVSHDITDAPDIVRLAEEVARTGVDRVLRRSGEELAILSPIPTDEPSPTPGRSGETSPNAWLDDLVGIGSSGEGDVSANVHHYVAQALLDESEKTRTG